jgi:hypothetical protein
MNYCAPGNECQEPLASHFDVALEVDNFSRKLHLINKRQQDLNFRQVQHSDANDIYYSELYNCNVQKNF